jgi:hypothetical protein
VILKEIERDSR